MDSLTLFKQKLNERNSVLIVSMMLPAMVVYDTTKSGVGLGQEGRWSVDTITLNSGADAERFSGLVINTKTMTYSPLQKVPSGHRFFSFEGIKKLEMTVTKHSLPNSEPGLKEAFTFQFDVDPHKYALVNACTTMLFTYLSQKLSVSWVKMTNQVIVRDGGNVIINRTCPIDKYYDVIKKLQQNRIQNFY